MYDDVTNTDTSGMRGADASSVRQCASGTMRMRRRMHVQYMEVEEDACAEMKEEAGTNAPPAQ